MLIVDASCLYEVVADRSSAPLVLDRLEFDPDHGAPHVIDAEVLGTIRREHLLGQIDLTTANVAVTGLRDWVGERFSHVALLDRAWQLRGNVRTWDALYVALAESLGATLLTADPRLSRAVGPR